ncbi:MAG: hypothetical protein ACE5GG_04810 [Candidatus Omnitrophota bacterium]
MKAKDIDLFFASLSKKWPRRAKIRLLGGAGSLLMGGARPTLDIDFEVIFTRDLAEKDKQGFQAAVEKTKQETGIAAQFSEDIDRWSQISLLDYRRHASLYERFRNIWVYILNPEYWSIGKITRYWDQDIQDMFAVFKRMKTNPVSLLEVWAAAISKSPVSSQLLFVKRHIRHFFVTFGKEIWGKGYPRKEILSRIAKISR